MMDDPQSMTNPRPIEIVWMVRRGDRTKADLRRCGCAKCKEALKILNRKD